MRLTRVLFNRVVRLRGHGPVQEVTASMVDGLRYVANPPSVVLGHQTMAIPWHCVIEYDGIHDDPCVCQDCGEHFATVQGLGGHRASKHKGAA